MRDIDLIKYLPPFVREYREMQNIMTAENPEFILTAEETQRINDNQFIVSCDEQGIATYEKFFKLHPAEDDTLESRRSRVLSKWIDAVPYTMKTFTSKLIALTGGTDFTVTTNFGQYKMTLKTSLAHHGQIEELKNIIKTWIPCNILVETENRTSYDITGHQKIEGRIYMTYKVLNIAEGDVNGTI